MDIVCNFRRKRGFLQRCKAFALAIINASVRDMVIFVFIDVIKYFITHVVHVNHCCYSAKFHEIMLFIPPKYCLF